MTFWPMRLVMQKIWPHSFLALRNAFLSYDYSRSVAYCKDIAAILATIHAQSYLISYIKYYFL